MYGGTSLASAWSEGVGERGPRLLAQAALVSLALHALLLALLPYYRELGQPRALPPIIARLVKPKPPPEPPKVEPPPPILRPAPAVRPQAQPRPRPAVPAAVEPAPAPPTPVIALAPSRQAAEPAFVVPAPPAQRAEPRPEPAAVAASGLDPEAVKRFGIELREIAKRYKRYPRIARDNNWEGTVELGIAFGENGMLSLLSVKSSSGRAVLDEEAQAMLRSTIAKIGIPPALRGRAFRLDIPVRFSLEEER